MLCKTCQNAKTEVPTDVENYDELVSMMEDMKNIYADVFYCSAKNTIVVANEGTPTQDITECEDYVSS